MKEFIEKLIGEKQEKLKVTSLEIIVTGTNDKPYFEIKYKEIGKEYYNIGYSSYYLNKVFDWKEKYFEIVNELAEEHKGGWIPCSERLPKDEELSQRKEVIVQNRYGEIFTAEYTYNSTHTHKDFFRNHYIVPYVTAWQPLPGKYIPKGEQ